MRRLVVTTVLAILLSIVGTSAIAHSQVNYRYTISIEGTFDDVYDEFKNAIIDQGLTIDYVGNVDQMLERTSQVNSSENSKQATPVYLFAKYMQFCSSALTHRAVQANPQNLSMCPFLVFIYETTANPGHTVIGYRPPTLSTDEASKVISQAVVLFLNGILNEVASNY
jgi:uncharacterized protein (DUF302 family)